MTGTSPEPSAPTLPRCPVHPSGQRKILRDDEPSTPEVEWVDGDTERVLVIRSFALARRLLRDGQGTRQAGFLGDLILQTSSIREPIIYLEGSEHRELRSATARFFAPRVVERDYRQMIDEQVAHALNRVRSQPVTRVDDLSLRLAVAVAARVVGLTDSDQDRMARRLDNFFEQRIDEAVMKRGPIGLLYTLKNHRRLLSFYFFDVRPSVRARRRAPSDDIISHLLGKGYKDLDILTECITFAGAGMVTTREFISMATWHLLENPGLRAAYLAGDRPARMRILEEIVRLEPVVGNLKRRLTADLTLEHDGTQTSVPAGTMVDVQVRATNADPAVYGNTGRCLHPERELGRGAPRAGLAFGDGHHKCPGEFLALEESDTLLHQLLAMDLRIERTPSVGWVDVVTGYDLRHFVVSLASDQPWSHPALTGS